MKLVGVGGSVEMVGAQACRKGEGCELCKMEVKIEAVRQHPRGITHFNTSVGC